MSGQHIRDWMIEKYQSKLICDSSYDLWTDEEEQKLLQEIQSDIPIHKIAESHKRTRSAISCRIKKIAYLMYLKNEPENEILYKTKLTKTVLDNVIKRNRIIKETHMPDIESLAKRIYTQLGSGYSERVYHNCMEVLLRKEGIQYESERILPVYFENHVVGHLRADIIINNEIVLEFKAIKTLNEQAECQLRNYLRLTQLKTGYLINFPIHPDRGVEVRHIVVGEQ